MTLRQKDLIVGVLLISSCGCSAQCITGLQQLVPAATTYNLESFGRPVAIYEDLLAVAASNSDSLGFKQAGVVYLYRRVNGTWRSLTTLRSATPSLYDSFGLKIRITQNYVLILSHNSLHIFRKPLDNWTNLTETTVITIPGTIFFSFDVAEDEQTIILSSPAYPYGAMIVFHKHPAEEWNNPTPVQNFQFPASTSQGGLQGFDVDMEGNRVAAGGTSGPSYIYQDTSGTFTNYELETTFGINNPPTVTFNPSFLFAPDGIFRYNNGFIEFFQSPAIGPWTSSSPTCTIPIGTIGGNNIDKTSINYWVDGDIIYVGAQFLDKVGRLFSIKRTGTSWCSGFTTEIIYTEPIPSSIASEFMICGLSSYHQTDLVIGHLNFRLSDGNWTHAAGILTQNADHTWSKQLVYKPKYKAENTQFGWGLYQAADYLFASGPNERVFGDQARGAVNIYRKTNGTWGLVNKLGMDPTSQFNLGFGTFIAGYDNYVIVSSFYNQTPSLQIYKGTDGNYTNPTLIQTLTLPTNLGINSYTTPAMNSDWIIIPCLRNPDFVYPSLLFYKKDNTDHWSYHSMINLTGGIENVVFKSTPVIDLVSNTLVTSSGGNQVYVLDWDTSSLTWKINSTLKASDPDADPFFGTATVDGSLFGSAIKMTDQAIFVGAPGKNIGTTNDVGSVYVFLKDANGKWKSGTETTKILPAQLTQSLGYGISLAGLENTLAVSAFSNVAPGRVDILQSNDPTWSTITKVGELSGESKGQDYFGFTVSLGANDILIGAPYESRGSETRVGKVYATSSPAIPVKLPTTCINDIPFTFQNSPQSGNWSGPGITNGTVGLFDPVKAGPGKHLLSFQKPSCPVIAQSQIEVLPAPPEPAINSIGELCTGPAQLTVSSKDPGSLYSWYKDGSVSPLASGPVIEVSSPGTYFVKATKGICHNQSLPFQIKLSRDSLFVPNVITPNADSYNDEFRIVGHNLGNFSLKLIDRDGNDVYSSQDANFKWSAPDTPSGVYYWSISYSNCANLEVRRKGWLSIVK